MPESFWPLQLLLIALSPYSQTFHEFNGMLSEIGTKTAHHKCRLLTGRYDQHDILYIYCLEKADAAPPYPHEEINYHPPRLIRLKCERCVIMVDGTTEIDSRASATMSLCCSRDAVGRSLVRGWQDRHSCKSKSCCWKQAVHQDGLSLRAILILQSLLSDSG